jgi:hypothetical protein
MIICSNIGFLLYYAFDLSLYYKHFFGFFSWPPGGFVIPNSLIPFGRYLTGPVIHFSFLCSILLLRLYTLKGGRCCWP